MRRAVTMLQCAHSLCQGSSDGSISTADVEEMSGEIPQIVADKFLNALGAKNATFATMQSALDDLLSEGFPGISILTALHRHILSPICPLSDASKSQISLKIAECDKCLVDGADENLQLLDVSALVLRCFKNVK